MLNNVMNPKQEMDHESETVKDTQNFKQDWKCTLFGQHASSRYTSFIVATLSLYNYCN